MVLCFEKENVALGECVERVKTIYFQQDRYMARAGFEG
jgi:hypothetical protein